MANENALKMAFQKKHPASRILSFDRCFMGRSLICTQITDKPAFRDGLPLNIFVDYVPFFDPERPEESTEAALATIKKHISRYPKEHALMCFELIQGEGGFYPGSKHFFRSIMTLLKEHDIAILIDEVQTFGRTPSLFAFRSTSAIRASKIIIESLLNGHYFGPNGKIMQMHQHMVQHLQKMSSKYPERIQGPFGLGAMIAFTPFGGNKEKVEKFVHALFEAGVISFVAGTNPMRVRFLVPMGVITTEDIDNAMSIVEKTLINFK
jgi:4-aminobutyrate aminotransferase-like enzyme